MSFIDFCINLYFIILYMFGYCIWLMPTEESILYSKTNQFLPHISLKTNLSKQEAEQLMEIIIKKPLHLSISKKNEYNEYERFYSYYHIISEYPNYHISFLYDKEEIPLQKRNEMYNSLNFTSKYKFDTYKIVWCDDIDYKKWYIVN